MNAISGKCEDLVVQLYKNLELLSNADHRTGTAIQMQIALSLSTFQHLIRKFEDLEATELSIPKKLAAKEKITYYRSEFTQMKLKFDEAKRTFEARARMGLLNSTIRQNVQSSLSNGQSRSLNISIAQTEEYIELGTFSLGDLKRQRGMMQKAQKKALQVIETLGVSKDTMKQISIRLKSDAFVFYGGIAMILFLIWILLR
jgi:hypothetical protein